MSIIIISLVIRTYSPGNDKKNAGQKKSGVGQTNPEWRSQERECMSNFFNVLNIGMSIVLILGGLSNLIPFCRSYNRSFYLQTHSAANIRHTLKADTISILHDPQIPKNGSARSNTS